MNSSQDISSVWEELVCDGGRIVYLVLDGAGGLRDSASGKTALELARTPHLDRVMRESACSLLELVGPGITPAAARAIWPCSAMIRCNSVSGAV